MVLDAVTFILFVLLLYFGGGLMLVTPRPVGWQYNGILGLVTLIAFLAHLFGKFA